MDIFISKSDFDVHSEDNNGMNLYFVGLQQYRKATIRYISQYSGLNTIRISIRNDKSQL